MRRDESKRPLREGRGKPFAVGRYVGRICALVLIVFVTGDASAAVPVLYHSPTGDGNLPAASPPPVPANGILDLWIDGGSVATPPGQGVVCLSGIGDELCGWQFDLVTTGGVAINSFSAASMTSGEPIRSYSVSAQQLRLNRVNAAAPNAGDLGRIRIGTLNLSVSGPGEVRIHSGSEAVGAALQVMSIDETTIAVPEPSILCGIMLGGAGFSFSR